MRRNDSNCTNIPRKIGDARHEWADPWPRNCPNAISSKIIGKPMNINIIVYGKRNAIPWRFSSRGKRTTFAYVRFRHRHKITPRNIEHFDCKTKRKKKKKHEHSIRDVNIKVGCVLLFSCSAMCCRSTSMAFEWRPSTVNGLNLYTTQSSKRAPTFLSETLLNS